MNEIVNTFSLAGDRFMPEMLLKQLGLIYSACGPFSKNKERIQKFKEKGDTSYIYKNELDKACFQYDTAYGDFKDNTYVDSKKEVNDKYPKFKVGDHVRISKYKSIFAKGYTPNWSEEVFVVSKIKNTVPWTYVINDLNGEEIIGTFYEKELQKTNEKEFRIEKVLKRKGNKLYVKWKGYNSSFNSWINKKDLV